MESMSYNNCVGQFFTIVTNPVEEINKVAEALIWLETGGSHGCTGLLSDEDGRWQSMWGKRIMWGARAK